MEIPGVDLLFFYLTSFGATSTKSVRRLLFISPFSDEVSAQFSMSQLRNMIVLAARWLETLFVRQIALSMRKKMVKKNSQGAKVDNIKFWIQLLTRKRKKKKQKKEGTLYLFH